MGSLIKLCKVMRYIWEKNFKFSLCWKFPSIIICRDITSQVPQSSLLPIPLYQRNFFPPSIAISHIIYNLNVFARRVSTHITYYEECHRRCNIYMLDEFVSSRSPKIKNFNCNPWFSLFVMLLELLIENYLEFPQFANVWEEC